MKVKKIFISILIALFALQPLLATLIVVRTQQYYQSLLISSNVTTHELKQYFEEFLSGLTSDAIQPKVWLILGLDSLGGRQQPPLTDTMLLIRFSPKENSLITLPLPRDLWSDTYKTKINALYSYGDQFYPNNPKQFVAQVVSEMTGVPIDQTLIVSIDDVVALVDIIDGITISVDRGFIDQRFPRQQESISRDDSPPEDAIYETVEFVAGTQSMSAHQVNQFMRSRMSNSEEGTDNARSARQQQVITAIADTLIDPQTLLNPHILGGLLKYYRDRFESQVSIADLAYLLKAHPTQISHGQLSIATDGVPGVLFNPPQRLYGNQWVYTATDSAVMQQHIQSLLSIEQ